jgi:hypothetical protein
MWLRSIQAMGHAHLIGVIAQRPVEPGDDSEMGAGPNKKMR